MMPWAKLNMSPVTTSQPPHRSRAARVRSVRGARRVHHSPASPNNRAAGISQAIWPPISELNMRLQPVAPQAPAWPVPPPMTLPASLPVSRPKPL